MNKTCTKCKEEKDINDFCVVRKNRDKRNTRCKKCCNSLSKEWKKKEDSKTKIRISTKTWRTLNRDRINRLKKIYRDRDPERSKSIVRKSLEKNKEKYKPQKWRRALQRLYGLTPEEFYFLQEDQSNVCAICGKPERDSRRQKLCVDHCHKTKKVRGLLCFSCNVILGNAKDNPVILRAAADYLEKHNGLFIQES